MYKKHLNIFLFALRQVRDGGILIGMYQTGGNDLSLMRNQNYMLKTTTTRMVSNNNNFFHPTKTVRYVSHIYIYIYI